MRLLLDAEIRPETVDRLRALSPDLDVVDVTRRRRPSTSRRWPTPRSRSSSGRGRRPTSPACPSLRWLQVRSAGVDHLAADPPWRKGLLVTNAKGVYAIPIGEYVSGMVLRIHQPPRPGRPTRPPIAGRGRAAARSRSSAARPRSSSATARSAARSPASWPALGLRIVAVKPRPEVRADTSFRVPGTGDPDGSIPERIVGDAGLAEVAREADVLVLTMPLTDATRGIVSREVIAALPGRAWLINVSRGALVDEPALLEALRAGRLAGAVLDVFGQEPLPPDSPWWDAPNVIVTPHASGHTLRFFDELVVENVRRYLAGEPLLNPVDPERGY